MASSFVDAFVWLAGNNAIVQALVAGTIITGMNFLGAALVLVWRNPSQRSLDGLLGFAAGVMLAAAFTSLILPGITEYSGESPILRAITGYSGESPLPTLVGIGLGALVLDRADALTPQARFILTGGEGSEDDDDRSETLPAENTRVTAIVLFVLAITLHNMPEGLAVGVGFGGAAAEPDQLGRAVSLMLAIGVQNVPEGLAVSVAAMNAGLDRRLYAVFTGIRAGAVEIPLALVGAVSVTTIEPLLPYAMGFAAGAMVFVISDEIIPETHRNGHERVATFGLIAGLILMVFLDTALAAG